MSLMLSPEPVTPDKVLSLWTDLIKNPDVHWAETPLSLALSLYSDATKTFAANSTPGAAILCRAAIDAACLGYLVHWKEEGQEHTFRIEIPRGLDGRTRDVPWSELRGAVRESRLFSDDELLIIDRVREHGNVIAHQMERYLKWVDSVGREPPAGKKAKSAWISQSETWDDLKDTSWVVERLCVSVYKKPVE